jgi:hypothetical protein
MFVCCGHPTTNTASNKSHLPPSALCFKKEVNDMAICSVVEVNPTKLISSSNIYFSIFIAIKFGSYIIISLFFILQTLKLKKEKMVRLIPTLPVTLLGLHIFLVKGKNYSCFLLIEQCFSTFIIWPHRFLVVKQNWLHCTCRYVELRQHPSAF